MEYGECTEYRQWLREVSHEWRQFKPLLKFLEEKGEHDAAESSQLAVFDIVKQDVVLQEFDVSNDGWKEYLKKDLSHSSLRIVVFSHADATNVSREMLDLIGSQFDINPIEYGFHFNETSHSQELLGPRSLYTPIKAQATSTQIGFWPFDHTSLIYPDTVKGRTPTVCVLKSLGRPLGGGQSYSSLRNIKGPRFKDRASTMSAPKLETHFDCFKYALTSCSPPELKALATHPSSLAMLVLPDFIAHWQSRLTLDLHNRPSLYPVSPKLNQKCADWHRASQNELASFRSTKWYVDATCAKETIAPVFHSKLQDYCEDLDHLAKQAQEDVSNLERYMRSCTDLQAASDAEESDKMIARRAAKFTFAALILASLLVAAAMFGPVLEWRTTEVGPTVAIATAVSFAAMLAIITVPKLQVTIEGILNGVSNLAKVSRHPKLAMRSPKAFVLLLSYAGTHTSRDTEWLLWTVGLQETLNTLHGEPLRMPSNFYKRRQEMLKEHLEAFWASKAVFILEQVSVLKPNGL